MELKHQKKKVLELIDIHTFIGRSHVIQGLSMHINSHETVSILGRNGVGKTTTVRSILALTPPRSGQIKIDGDVTTSWPTHKIIRKGVSYVPAERNIFPGLNVEENLKLGARPTNKDGWTLEKVYTHFPVLKARRKQDGVTLSGGEQQMVALGRALMLNPIIMVLDEPSQGLAPLLIKTVIEPILVVFAEVGLTVLIVEQNYRMVLNIASRHYLMGMKGRISRVATSSELIANPEIIKKHISI